MTPYRITVRGETGINDGFPVTPMTVAEVVAWLEEQGVGKTSATQVMSENGHPRCVLPIDWHKKGLYYVIPLVEEGV